MNFPNSLDTDSTLWLVVNGVASVLDGALANDTNGNNGSATEITLNSTTGFPSVGHVVIDSEIISYTGISGVKLTGITRGADSSTKASHTDGVDVKFNVIAKHHNDLKDALILIETFLISTRQWGLTASPSSDHKGTGITLDLTAKVTMNFGDIGMIASDGKVALAKADAIANANGIVMCVDASISADASGKYMLLGVARDDTWAWTVGGLIYLSTTGTTGNTLTQTAPSGTNNVIQVLGVATHADRMIFLPNLVQVEHV
jgi:hypothetical protein